MIVGDYGDELTSMAIVAAAAGTLRRVAFHCTKQTATEQLH